MISDLAVFQMTDHLGNYDNEMFKVREVLRNHAAELIPRCDNHEYFSRLLHMFACGIECPKQITMSHHGKEGGTPEVTVGVMFISASRCMFLLQVDWLILQQRDVRTELGIIIRIIIIIIILICSACKRKRALLKFLGPIYGWYLINGSVTITLNFNIIINHYPLYTLSMLMLIVVIRYI